MSKRLVALAHIYYKPFKIKNMYTQKTTERIWQAFLKEIEGTSMEKMAKAVIEQLGGVDYEAVFGSLNTMRNGNDGYTGFIYYTETSKFWNDNKEVIMENMHEMADDLGEDLIKMIKGFGGFKDDDSVTYDAIGKALYGPYDEEENRCIYDTFAKYALEEVANSFQNWWYEQDDSDYK